MAHTFTREARRRVLFPLSRPTLSAPLRLLPTLIFRRTLARGITAGAIT